jgi:hypothetical protein
VSKPIDDEMQLLTSVQTSAILTMRDSRTAISQNSTVQRLTYLTIGYLPVALMAAIFAIPPEQHVLFLPMADHGRSWFVGAILILSITTYTLAVYIGNVLDFFRIPPPKAGGGKKMRSQDPPNLWKGIWIGGKWCWNAWFKGDSMDHQDGAGAGNRKGKGKDNDLKQAELGEGKLGSGSETDSNSHSR